MSQIGTFSFFADIIIKHAGIALDDSKYYLLETRLAPMCKRFECADLGQLHDKLKHQLRQDEIREIVEALTTNETWWLRDQQMFDALRDSIWPALIKRAKRNGKGTVDMWCAASSTGQEPYSLKMWWSECGFGNSGVSLKLYCTDIDTNVLTQAKSGDYSQLDIGRGLPAPMLVKYFTQKDARWVINDDLKQSITWAQLNLMERPILSGFFDLVLCRNVLIYFTPEGKEVVLNTLTRALHPHGMLFIGGSESLIGLECELRRIGVAKAFAYAKPQAEALLIQ